MSHTVEFSLIYSCASNAQRIERSIQPEVGEIESDRTQVTLDREDHEVSISLEADDLVALRAGINTWLTLASVAERSAEPHPA